MRGNYQRETTSALLWLVSALVAGFALQLVLEWNFDAPALYQSVGLTTSALAEGRVWTLLTHSFLHSPHFIFHVVGNVVALYFLGRELLPILGARRFLGTYAAATLVGGLTWLAVHWRLGGDPLLGATAAVDAFLIIYVCFFPNHKFNFLLFFIIPVSLKPKHLAFALAGFDLWSLIYFEIPGATLPLGLTAASSAHLGGMAVGLAYYRFIHDAEWSLRQLGAVAAPPMNQAKPTPAVPATPVNARGSRDEIRAEVDRILDKINREGFTALTVAEKRILDEARDVISRR